MIEHQSPSRRRLLVTGAGVAGVLLGLVLLVTVLGGGGDERPVALRPGPKPASGPRPTAAESPPVDATTTLPPPEGRDPFRQLVTVPEEAPAAGAPAPGPAQPTTAGPPATEAPPTTQAPPTTPAPAAPPAMASEGAESPPAAPPAGARYAQLELRSIFLDPAGIRRADITVDGQPFQPAAGEVFAFGFQVERLDDRCVTVVALERLELCLP